MQVKNNSRRLTQGAINAIRCCVHMALWHHKLAKAYGNGEAVKRHNGIKDAYLASGKFCARFGVAS